MRILITDETYWTQGNWQILRCRRSSPCRVWPSGHRGLHRQENTLYETVLRNEDIMDGWRRGPQNTFLYGTELA